jgi:lysozyme family protein
VRYWNRVAGDDLPDALALCVFDFAVNAGPGRAAKLLQRIVGAVADGQVGKGTLAAVNAYVVTHGVAAAVKAYQDARKTYYRSLPTFEHFGKGWLARVDRVTKEALA